MHLGVSLISPLAVGSVPIRNRVFLAPLSGVTDDAFRARAYRHGAGLVVSEMVASGELAKGRGDTSRRILRPDVDVHVVQLAGREANAMAEAARIAVDGGADIIDINMGCPAKKVTGGYCGSALMQDLDLAATLIDAVIAAVSVPVTVKMRLGWDETALNAPILARRAEQSGVAMITVHGRTRCQFYNGQADWRAIRRVKESVSIPVVANGDIQTAGDVSLALELSGADALMVGRAHYGKPWAAAQLVAEMGGPPAMGVPHTVEERISYIAAHYDAMLSLYGIGQGLRHARKHLGWYLDRFAVGGGRFRNAAMTGTDPASVVEAVRSAFLSAAEDHIARAA